MIANMIINETHGLTLQYRLTACFHHGHAATDWLTGK